MGAGNKGGSYCIVQAIYDGGEGQMVALEINGQCQTLKLEGLVMMVQKEQMVRFRSTKGRMSCVLLVSWKTLGWDRFGQGRISSGMLCGRDGGWSQKEGEPRPQSAPWLPRKAGRLSSFPSQSSAWIPLDPLILLNCKTFKGICLCLV